MMYFLCFTPIRYSLTVIYARHLFVFLPKSHNLGYNQLKGHLSEREKDFFFKSSVDFVVFEPFRSYFPIYFFEIDSIWHDAEEQKAKDKIKDKNNNSSGYQDYQH